MQPDALAVLPKLVWHYDEPFADSSAVPTWYLSELTRRHVTVALTGDGGDELFAGYPRYRAVWLAARMDRLPGWLRAALAGPLLAAVSRRPAGNVAAAAVPAIYRMPGPAARQAILGLDRHLQRAAAGVVV